MTWSLVARDPASGAFGVAVTTKAFAVGARVPWVASGVGAVATQSFTNPMLGAKALVLLGEGVPARDVVARLLAEDEGRAVRQLHLVDRAGRVAAHTGESCIGWAGHLAGDFFSVAGNMLAGAAVVKETWRAYQKALDAAAPFAERLIAALEAGQRAGGDKRGKQSAALLIHTSEDYPELSLRVDDAMEPLVELRRLYTVWQRDVLPTKAITPTRAHPWGIHQPREIEALWAKAGRPMTFDKS
jgi:uncharacterized Ntn-hydrolase superfamily protein